MLSCLSPVVISMWRVIEALLHSLALLVWCNPFNSGKLPHGLLDLITPLATYYTSTTEASVPYAVQAEKDVERIITAGTDLCLYVLN